MCWAVKNWTRHWLLDWDRLTEWEQRLKLRNKSFTCILLAAQSFDSQIWSPMYIQTQTPKIKRSVKSVSPSNSAHTFPSIQTHFLFTPDRTQASPSDLMLLSMYFNHLHSMLPFYIKHILVFLFNYLKTLENNYNRKHTKKKKKSLWCPK